MIAVICQSLHATWCDLVSSKSFQKTCTLFVAIASRAPAQPFFAHSFSCATCFLKAMSESEYVPSEFCRAYSDSSDESDSHMPPRPRHKITFVHNMNTYEWTFPLSKPWRSGKSCEAWIEQFLRTKTPLEIGIYLWYHVNNDTTMRLVLTRLNGEEIEWSDRVYTSNECDTVIEIKFEKKVEMFSPMKRRKM